MMFPHHGSLQKGYVYCKKRKKNQAIYFTLLFCYTQLDLGQDENESLVFEESAVLVRHRKLAVSSLL